MAHSYQLQLEPFEFQSEYVDTELEQFAELTDEEWEEEFGRRRRVPNRRTRHHRAPPNPDRKPKRRPRRPNRPYQPGMPPGWSSVGTNGPVSTASMLEPEGSEYVRWVQTMLNQALNLQLPVDGVTNVQTRSAVRSFQEQRGLPVTGIVGPDTERALLAPGSPQSSSGAETSGERPASADKPAPSTSSDPSSPASAAEFELSWDTMMDEYAPDFEANATACPPFTPVAVEKLGGGRLKDKTIPAGSNLVLIQGAFAKTPLHRLAAEALRALVCAARADGIKHPLLLSTGSRSGHRDPKMQKAAWERALVKYKSEAEARKWVAKPGFSAHQTGRAVDLYLGVPNGSANVARLRRTPAYKWMVANARRFGFYPYPTEPWHWEYNPPASGGSDVSFAWSGASDWESEAALDVLSPTEMKAVRITSTFETGRPGGFGGLTGNFDGQGLSFGLMNFAFKAGSLPPLLQVFITKHPDRYAAAFGKDADRFEAIVFATRPDPSNPRRRVRDLERQMGFVNTQMNLYPRKARGNKIVEPWKSNFRRLENNPDFQKIQIKAVRRALERARYWYNYFEFKTERGFVFMFDLVSSHGGAWLNAPRFKGRRRVLLQKMLAAKKARLGRDTLTEREKMEVIANMIADVSLPEWREKARVRKLWFVRGIGEVHGHTWDIRKDFGVADNAPDFGSARSQEFEWEFDQVSADFQWESSQGNEEFQGESGEHSQELQWESDPDSANFEHEQPEIASVPPLLGAPEEAAIGETLYVQVGLGKGLPASTGIFVPGHFRPSSDVSIIVYLHGHKSAYPGNSVLIRGYWDSARFPFFGLREEVAASRKNVIFIAPSLGTTSQAGSLVQKGGFDAFMEKVVAAINAHYLQPRGMRPLADVQTIILAAHSGGGSPMLRIAAGSDRLARKIKECWGFDSMYGGVGSSWLAWAKSHPSRTYYAYFGPAKGYTNKQGRFVASPRDNAEAIACAVRRQNITNVCMQPSRATKINGVSAHFWVPKVHLNERLQNHPCSAGDICPHRKPRARSQLEVTAPSGILSSSSPANNSFVQQIWNAFTSGQWYLGLGLAVLAGMRDENELASVIFFARHPERGGRKMEKSEPDFKKLSQEWLDIRDRIVRPYLARSAPASTSTVTSPTRHVSLSGTPHPEVNTPLPTSGQGFVRRIRRGQEMRSYGLPEIIRALQEIAAEWHNADPRRPRIQIMDISPPGGSLGRFEPHGSHRVGLDVDLNLEGGQSVWYYKKGPGQWQENPKYSRTLTAELARLILTHPKGGLKVQFILFDDPAIRFLSNKVKQDTKSPHRDHFHVRFCTPPYFAPKVDSKYKSCTQSVKQ